MKEVRYLAFDFDDTITNHDNKLSALFLNGPFLNALRKMIKGGKVKCVIATFSTPERVYEFLEEHGLMDLFEAIYSTNKFDDGKNVILKNITKDFIATKDDVVLIDNDKTNIKKASQKGYATIQVDTDGLVRGDFQRIKKFLAN